MEKREKNVSLEYALFIAGHVNTENNLSRPNWCQRHVHIKWFAALANNHLQSCDGSM